MGQANDPLANWFAAPPPKRVRVPVPRTIGPNRPLPHVILRAVLLGIAYVAIAKGTDELVLLGGAVAVASFWPVAGVTVAAMLRSPRREWPWLMAGIWIAEFSLDLASHAPVGLATCWAFADSIEPVVAAVLFLRFARRSLNLADLPTFLRFVGFAVLAGPVVGALLGATGSALAGFGSWEQGVTRWAIGDGIGVLVVTPILLLDRSTLRGLRDRAGLLSDSLLIPAAIMVLGPWPWATLPGLPFVVLPFLVLQAFRSGHANTALSIAGVALFTNLVSITGHGPFGVTATFNGLIPAQLFLAMCAFTMFVVSALTSNLVARDKLEAVLREQSFHDGLTGLGNRRFISEHVERLPRHAGRMIGLLFIDLDGFKPVNDLFGHVAGDALLVETGRRIQESVRPGDGVARLGGDEFLVLLDDIASVDEARATAERLTAALARPLIWGDSKIATGASIGVSVAESVTADIEALLIEADHDMYRVKRLSKTPDASTSATLIDPRRRTLLEDIGAAAPRAEFLAMYQPIVDLRTEEVIGAEALLRWQHPTLGLLTPNEFIPVAEETGAIVELGRWILFDACRTAGALNAAAPGRRLVIHVNVSRIQLDDISFDRDVSNALRSTGLAPDLLVLEITESVLAVDVQAMALRLKDLKKIGVRIAMDDFGTGYSSLAALSTFPLDYIKIDRAFVNASGEASLAGSKLLTWVISLSNELAIRSVAEGVETPQQRDFLRQAGCSLGQGFLFARPEHAAALEARLAVREPTTSQGRNEEKVSQPMEELPA
jgi:diguanylate cyclase (GGDEF)-like protein